jgi:hypothetical protein
MLITWMVAWTPVLGRAEASVDWAPTHQTESVVLSAMVGSVGAAVTGDGMKAIASPPPTIRSASGRNTILVSLVEFICITFA